MQTCFSGTISRLHRCIPLDNECMGFGYYCSVILPGKVVQKSCDFCKEKHYNSTLVLVLCFTINTRSQLHRYLAGSVLPGAMLMYDNIHSLFWSYFPGPEVIFHQQLQTFHHNILLGKVLWSAVISEVAFCTRRLEPLLCNESDTGGAPINFVAAWLAWPASTRYTIACRWGPHTLYWVILLSD